MRRTRRSKKWVAVALVLWVGSDVVHSMPGIQQRGWIGAIPEPVLVLMIPFFDGTPGSSFDQTMWRFGAPATVWDQIGNEIRHYSWNEPRSWVADRLVFLLARLDSKEVITDSTTDRGTLYASRINWLINRDKAYGFETRWARSVVYAEFHTRAHWAPAATVFGALKIRRMVQGVYRVDVGQNVAWFESHTRSDSVVLGGGGFSRGGPGIASKSEYVELQQWDSLKRLPRIPYGESSEGEMMISRYQLDPAAIGLQTKSVPVTVYERFGDPRLSVRWEEVASEDISFSYIADPGAGPEIVEDPKLADILDSYIDVTLGFRFDRETSSWRLVASLTNDGLTETESITFGGEVSIEVQKREGQQVSYKRLLRGPKKWWRWEPPTRPPEGMDEKSREYWELWSNGELIPSGSESVYAGDAWGIAFQEDGSFVQMNNSDGRLVLRVRTEDSGFERIVFADPKATRVLFGELVFPIKDWTIEELNRYRMSGEIPSHAMP